MVSLIWFIYGRCYEKIVSCVNRPNVLKLMAGGLGKPNLEQVMKTHGQSVMKKEEEKMIKDKWKTSKQGQSSCKGWSRMPEVWDLRWEGLEDVWLTVRPLGSILDVQTWNTLIWGTLSCFHAPEEINCKRENLGSSRISRKAKIVFVGGKVFRRCWPSS